MALFIVYENIMRILWENSMKILCKKCFYIENGVIYYKLLIERMALIYGTIYSLWSIMRILWENSMEILCRKCLYIENVVVYYKFSAVSSIISMWHWTNYYSSFGFRISYPTFGKNYPAIRECPWLVRAEIKSTFTWH